MCFSATASFSVAAGLAPVAIFALSRARQQPRWMALAAYPLAFGIQQFIEGLLWIAIEARDETGIALASRGFLFFSHFFWPAWVPLSVYLLEADAAPWRRNALMTLSIVGTLLGLSISLPSLALGDWLAVEVVNGSIEYVTRLVYDGIVDRQLLKLGYGAIVVSALLLSREPLVRVFAGIIVASLLFAELQFGYAFVSVWCFFAAVVSAQVAVTVALRVEGASAGRHAGR